MTNDRQSFACRLPSAARIVFFTSILACLLTIPGSGEEEEVSADAESVETKESIDDEEQTGELTPIEKILLRDPTAEDYEATVKCVNRRQIRNVEVLSDRFILLDMQSKEKYLIQLKRRCMSIKKGEFIRIDSRTGRFCKGDSVRGVVGAVPGMTNYGPPCRVPGFEPINDVQLEQLKLGLASKTVE